MTKRIAAATLGLILVLVLVAPNAQTQAKMTTTVSSAVGVTTISVDMPDASWAEIKQAYSDLNGAPADMEAFTLAVIQELLGREFSNRLAGANTKTLIEANPPSKID